MRTVYTMATAGMLLSTMIAQFKGDESTIKDFDVRAYLVEKLESAFLEIQADISLSVQHNVAELLESGYDGT